MNVESTIPFIHISCVYNCRWRADIKLAPLAIYEATGCVTELHHSYFVAFVALQTLFTDGDDVSTVINITNLVK